MTRVWPCDACNYSSKDQSNARRHMKKCKFRQPAMIVQTMCASTAGPVALKENSPLNTSYAQIGENALNAPAVNLQHNEELRRQVTVLMGLLDETMKRVTSLEAYMFRINDSRV